MSTSCENVSGFTVHASICKNLVIKLLTKVPPVAEELAASCLDNKLFRSSSLVSAPVFFNFGEPIAEAIPSLKAELVLILSA